MKKVYQPPCDKDGMHLDGHKVFMHQGRVYFADGSGDTPAQTSLLNFVVLYRTAEMLPTEAPMCFQCWGDNSDHAEEQCRNAYPDCDVVWVWEGPEGVGMMPAFDDYWNDLKLHKDDKPNQTVHKFRRKDLEQTRVQKMKNPKLIAKPRGFENSAHVMGGIHGTTVVAEVFSHVEAGDQYDTVALFAAAPELVDSLECLMHSVENEIEPHGRIVEAIKDARSIIAKAKRYGER